MKLAPFSIVLGVAAASTLPQKRQIAGTAYVDLSTDTGTPKNLASGFIYGIPDTQDQIPDKFYTGIGFDYGRAGGAQVPAPGRGWIWGLTEYEVRFKSLFIKISYGCIFHFPEIFKANSDIKNRFASALSNYQTTRKYDASFIFLIHDLWGADGTQNSSAPYPGDDGDWTSWDNYLTRFIADIKANSAIAGLSIDIWNEPDLTGFWNAPQSQWLEMYGRTYHKLRCVLKISNFLQYVINLVP